MVPAVKPSVARRSVGMIHVLDSKTACNKQQKAVKTTVRATDRKKTELVRLIVTLSVHGAEY